MQAQRNANSETRKLTTSDWGVEGPVRIAVLAPISWRVPPRHYGPWELFASLLTEGLVARGHDVTLFATGDSSTSARLRSVIPRGWSEDPSVDPTCAPSYPEEENDSITDPTEQQVVIGDWQGPDDSFDVPFKLVFAHPGQVLLCAYSDWITDTAASAQLLINVTSPTPSPASPVSAPTAPGPGASPNPPAAAATGGQAVVKPRNTRRPRVKRSGRFLSCTRGDWSNTPSTFSYRWLVNGRGLLKANKSRLAVSRSLHGHRVQCSVRAANAAGAGTAVSHSLTVP